MRKINRQKRGASNKPQATLQARKLRPRARSRQQLQLRRNNRLGRDLLQHARMERDSNLYTNRTSKPEDHRNKNPTLLARWLVNHRRLHLGALAQKVLLQHPHSPAANPALKRHLLLNLHLLGRVRSSEEKGDVPPLNRPLSVRKNQEVTRLRRSNFLQTTR